MTKFTSPVGDPEAPVTVAVNVTLWPYTEGFKEEATEVLVSTVVVNATLLSVLVEALFVLPATSVAPPAGTEATTFPAVVMPLTATLNVVGPPVTVATSVPLAVLPAKETLAA